MLRRVRGGLFKRGWGFACAAIVMSFIAWNGFSAAAEEGEPASARLGLRERMIKMGEVWCTLPIVAPSQAEIVRALPDPQRVRKNLRVRAELIQRGPDEPRDFPPIGKRRLLRSHFKCVAEWEGGSDVVYCDYARFMPADWPTAAEIVRALPVINGARQNVRCGCELILFKQEEARNYPLVGVARLYRAHYRCTVNSDRGKEVVYVDRDHLEPVK